MTHHLLQNTLGKLLIPKIVPLLMLPNPKNNLGNKGPRILSQKCIKKLKMFYRQKKAIITTGVILGALWEINLCNIRLFQQVVSIIMKKMLPTYTLINFKSLNTKCTIFMLSLKVLQQMNI
jgi:hypothetical protein